ncbi:MAG: hypothetical protein ACERKD_17415 [Prolixibacteraceae bacterium]
MNLPITLITYALTHKVVNQLRLYLYLKSACSGHFKLREENVTEACEFLSLKSEKTFHKNLQWLIYYKWVAYNSNTRGIRVISFSRLCHKLAITTKSGVVFEKDDFQNFRPFLYASVYAWSIRHKNWLERQPVRKKGRAQKCMSKATLDNYRGQMPNRYLAKILQLDHSTISRYKKAASTAGYILTEHQYKDTQLQIKFLYPMQKSLPEEAHLLVTHNNTVQRQLPDRITSTIHLKRRRLRPP